MEEKIQRQNKMQLSQEKHLNKRTAPDANLSVEYQRQNYLENWGNHQRQNVEDNLLEANTRIRIRIRSSSSNEQNHARQTY